jgi:hypothetical protein
VTIEVQRKALETLQAITAMLTRKRELDLTVLEMDDDLSDRDWLIDAVELLLKIELERCR